MNKWTNIHIHSTPAFYVETQCERKPRNDFSYLSLRITFIGSTNFLCFLVATGRRIWPPIFNLQPEGCSKSPIIWLQPEGGYNPLCSSATTGRRLQPPSFSRYNLREAPTPQFSSYNQKEATTTYVLRLQPECGYNHMSLPHPATLK